MVLLPDMGSSSSNILKQIRKRTHKEQEKRDSEESSDDEEDLHLLPSDGKFFHLFSMLFSSL